MMRDAQGEKRLKPHNENMQRLDRDSKTSFLRDGKKNLPGRLSFQPGQRSHEGRAAMGLKKTPQQYNVAASLKDFDLMLGDC